MISQFELLTEFVIIPGWFPAKFVEILDERSKEVVCLFRNKVMFLLKIVLIYEEPLISGQLPLSVHLWGPRRGGLPDRGSAVMVLNLPVFFFFLSTHLQETILYPKLWQISSEEGE